MAFAQAVPLPGSPYLLWPNCLLLLEAPLMIPSGMAASTSTFSSPSSPAAPSQHSPQYPKHNSHHNIQAITATTISQAITVTTISQATTVTTISKHKPLCAWVSLFYLSPPQKYDLQEGETKPAFNSVQFSQLVVADSL